ncbi:MAG: squalene/phytoene synthase family protein [Candidatus Micrarchaeota archaeon]|nr:squalene/phytoene synthase family protein [Candidatus Micrarchaeota archaeon]
MNDRQICWDLLPKVSRSFALCIRVLPEPLTEQMMLSYLIYRVIDTIEDSSAPRPIKKELFAQFTALLTRRSYSAPRVQAVRAALLSELNYTYEKELLENLPAVLAQYHALPLRVRGSIRRWGRVMARGMYDFQDKKIKTFADQDRYAYYVAGVIGYLFNDLLYYNRVIDAGLRRRLRTPARRFGQALQKVNILRDVAHDVPQQRYYWPARLLSKYRLTYRTLCEPGNREQAMSALNEVIENALDYLFSGMYYVLSLPQSAVRVRMFCIIPLFMAIESYIKCIRNRDIFASEKTVKISREQVTDIVSKSTLWGSSNAQLTSWFMGTMARANPRLLKTPAARALLRVTAAPAPVRSK